MSKPHRPLSPSRMQEAPNRKVRHATRPHSARSMALAAQDSPCAGPSTTNQPQNMIGLHSTIKSSGNAPRDYRDEGATPRPGWHGKRAWWPVAWPGLPIRVTAVWSWWLIRGHYGATTGDVFCTRWGSVVYNLM
ncbi:hypothetical protein E3N88_07182 [Mikania micrantha]|uniref:Uncharacterized protein n=1 Tax=Mikania micrantha TaxID=192012 RepID=A0A5N6PS72_9ASTR|nr:hypothetical protein E3N88_07182 [Mikania micrantha]